MDRQELTVTQFGSDAENYWACEVHSKGTDLAKGTDLEQVVELVRRHIELLFNSAKCLT